MAYQPPIGTMRLDQREGKITGVWIQDGKLKMRALFRGPMKAGAAVPQFYGVDNLLAFVGSSSVSWRNVEVREELDVEYDLRITVVRPIPEGSDA